MTRYSLLVLFIGFLFLWTSTALSEDDFYDTTPYARLLKKFVNDKGRVSYKALQAHPEDLEQFLENLARTLPDRLEQASEEEQVAFWLNAYNAFTLKAILDHYPIRASFLKSLFYPKNSIRQIPGVWDKIRFPAARRDWTLDTIEHGILRKRFHEPRIHVALVCAAKGCPPLRQEPYRGFDLEQQLDDQVVRFLSDREKFRIDRKQSTIYLSSIFKWFGKDFVENYRPENGLEKFDEPIRAAVNFIQRYLDPEDRAYLLHDYYKIQFVDYDWSLNEQ